MCGRLRREHNAERAGNQVGVVTNNNWSERGECLPITLANGETKQAEWNGHARSETLEGWTSKGWKECDLHVGSYTEGVLHTPFLVPANNVIKAIFREVNFSLIDGSTRLVFNIVTRDAVGNEKLVHPRFPQIVPKRF